MKKIITILAICQLAVSVAHAQIFITESNDDNPRSGTETDWGFIPQQWTTNDQANAYAPLGGGVVLLTVMGGIYLLKQKKNKEY